MEKNNFTEFVDLISKYLSYDLQSGCMISNLHDLSRDDSNKERMEYVYNGENHLQVLDMDRIARTEYKKIKGAADKDSIINTADAFIITGKNQWYFIEFKNSIIKAGKKGLKDNIIKKAYANWYMLLDILYTMYQKGIRYEGFCYENPVTFAKNNINYILVCKQEDNPEAYNLIKKSDLAGEKYTPPFMLRLKDYLFRDAYLYTDEFLERKFVHGFEY